MQPTSTSKVIAQFSMETDASSTTIKSSVEPNGDSPQLRPSLVEESTSAARQLMTEVENPWLAIANKSPRLSRKTNQTLVSKGSAVDVKSQATLKKHLAQSEDALAHRAEDAVVEIDLDNPLSLPAVPGPPEATSAKQRKPNRNIKGTAVDSAFQDSDDEDVGPDNGHQSAKAFKQRDLVALAFAGDNVVEVSDTRTAILSFYCLMHAIPEGIQLQQTEGDRGDCAQGNRHHVAWMGVYFVARRIAPILYLCIEFRVLGEEKVLGGATASPNRT